MSFMLVNMADEMWIVALPVTVYHLLITSKAKLL